MAPYSTPSHFPTYLPIRKEGFILLVEVSKTEEGTDEIEEKSLRMRMHSYTGERMTVPQDFNVQGIPRNFLFIG